MWKSVEDSSSVLGVVAAAALGFATFGASLVTLGGILTAGVLATSFSSVSASGGLYYPYVNSSRNNSQLNPMMLAKWSDYD